MAQSGSQATRKSFRDKAEEHYEKRGLVKRARLLVWIAVLTLLGRSSALREAFHWALQRRVTADEIREAILQTFLFAGYPRAIHAFEVLDEVLDERGVTDVPQTDRTPPRAGLRAFFRRRGRELFQEIYRHDTELVVNRIGRFQPEFMDWIIEDAYGKVLSRPYLDLKTREILSVALLTALKLPRQLTPHMRGALRAGAKPRELRCAILQLDFLLAKDSIEKALVRLERAETTL
ncbi:MAG: carboxymuconolactone decarboxylase family protein [Planctomycetota bacterium]